MSATCLLRALKMTESWQRVLAVWHSSSLAVRLRNSELLRFALAGGLNTLFGFAIYAVGVISELPVSLALFLGMLAGTVFNFFTTGAYVFRQLAVSRYPRFVVCYLFVYGVNVLFMNIFLLWMSNKLAIQAILTVPQAALSYVMMSRLVFISNPSSR